MPRSTSFCFFPFGKFSSFFECVEIEGTPLSQNLWNRFIGIEFQSIVFVAMPVPWKKVKSTRISRLVNDHLNISQKRRDGSSLVVETGFPTSLIDLFIKNREKLKKPSRKRRQSQPIASPDDVYDPVIEGSPISCPSPPPPPPPSPQSHTSVLPPPPPPPPPLSCANEICAQGSSGGGAVDGVDVEERGGDVNGVLIGVLKVFVVVVLALATKRLTVGITTSAVLLLLLEYVGKHCTAAMPVVQIFSRYKKLEEKQEPSTKPVSFSLSTSSIQEIQPLEEIQPEDSLSRSRERTRYQETELVEMAMKREESISDLTECKKKSRKAKIKSKMQKIVPKKFRGSKKDQDLASPQIVSKEEGDQCEDGSISISSSISECSEEEDGNGKSSIICLDRRLSNVIEESETKIEERSCRIEARRYMLLCLIVLAGLIGGRPFALALTLLWFLLLKLWPMIMSFNVKSG